MYLASPIVKKFTRKKLHLSIQGSEKYPLLVNPVFDLTLWCWLVFWFWLNIVHMCMCPNKSYLCDKKITNFFFLEKKVVSPFSCDQVHLSTRAGRGSYSLPYLWGSYSLPYLSWIKMSEFLISADFYSNFTLDRFEEFQNKISLLANKEQLSLANSWILFWDIQVKHKLKWYEALWILQVLKHINFKLLQCGVSWCFAYGNVFIPIAIKIWKITRHLLFWLMMVLLNDKKVNFVTEKKKTRIFLHLEMYKAEFTFTFTLENGILVTFMKSNFFTFMKNIFNYLGKVGSFYIWEKYNWLPWKSEVF